MLPHHSSAECNPAMPCCEHAFQADLPCVPYNIGAIPSVNTYMSPQLFYGCRSPGGRPCGASGPGAFHFTQERLSKKLVFCSAHDKIFGLRDAVRKSLAGNGLRTAIAVGIHSPLPGEIEFSRRQYSGHFGFGVVHGLGGWRVSRAHALPGRTGWLLRGLVDKTAAAGNGRTYASGLHRANRPMDSIIRRPARGRGRPSSAFSRGSVGTRTRVTV